MLQNVANVIVLDHCDLEFDLGFISIINFPFKRGACLVNCFQM